MKALNIFELRTFAQYLNEILKGGQLQEVLANDRGLALGFYSQTMHWLVLDLVPQSPVILHFADKVPFNKSKKSKPVALFLSSHGHNLYFEQVQVQEQWGRVLLLNLKNNHKQVELEIQLIPKQVNLIVRTDGKSIAWEKPRELKPALEMTGEIEERSLHQIKTEWLGEQGSKSSAVLDPVAEWEKQRQKDIQKKTKALDEIEKQLASDSAQVWAELGEHLKNEGLKNLKAEWINLVDNKKNLSWNIENAFAKSKQADAKRQGTLDRLQILRDEVLALREAKYSPKTSSKKIDDLMSKTEARGRKLNLSSGAIAYCGKSAADNLSLLRQAKAWDYWLHLKDYPGAHAIIHRQREQSIGENELTQVAQWLAKESLSSKSLALGQKLLVVMVECRFVKPIKGDKLGRVTYHSERSFVVQL